MMEHAWTDLQPEEEEVVKLLVLFNPGIEKLAESLETSIADIEDRLMGIRSKWKVETREEIIQQAEKRAWPIYLGK